MRRQSGYLFPSSDSSVRNPPPLERAEGEEEEVEEEGGDLRGGAEVEVEAGAGAKEEERWSRMLPELLGEIVRRVESSDGGWPLRKSVVSCACVCRRWREVTTGVVRPPTETGKITFPASLKQCPTMLNSQEESHKMQRADTLVSDAGTVVLKNKAPRWHENLQCWCLNFHGRVTVASVKNFQLVASSNAANRAGGADDDGDEPVLLQFGKVGDDMFTMDYREPLSAFQAFAICLTSFGTKFACE
ncbi:hypothetical protein B296_00010066 [Ensete ventricosum]|uniref:Tubby-like F-box protein n=1 Tax=Ensete ventricosum TaxID=4639 RepID=A0A426Z5G1_ENSVE|nr:hypothetical protein B296_00010066 [Ensete ventricosum]